MKIGTYFIEHSQQESNGKLCQRNQEVSRSLYVLATVVICQTFSTANVKKTTHF